MEDHYVTGLKPMKTGRHFSSGKKGILEWFIFNRRGSVLPRVQIGRRLSFKVNVLLFSSTEWSWERYSAPRMWEFKPTHRAIT